MAGHSVSCFENLMFDGLRGHLIQYLPSIHAAPGIYTFGHNQSISRATVRGRERSQQAHDLSFKTARRYFISHKFSGPTFPLASSVSSTSFLRRGKPSEEIRMVGENRHWRLLSPRSIKLTSIGHLDIDPMSIVLTVSRPANKMLKVSSLMMLKSTRYWYPAG